MKEVWKPIKNYENYYEVSNFGNIKSLERNRWNGFGNYKTKEFIMKTSKDKKGYLIGNFRVDKKSKGFKVHRIVASEFIDNALKKPEVNHINGIKSDNRVENLEWCTHKENMHHSIFILKNNTKHSNLTKKDIVAIRRLARVRNQKEIAKAYGISQSTVSRIYLKKSWKHIPEEITYGTMERH